MALNVLPVHFAGLKWGHPGHKHGRIWRPEEQLPQRLQTYRESINGIRLLDMLTLENEQEVLAFLRAAEAADVVLCPHAELLGAVWAAEALARSPVPVVLHGNENAPSAVFADIYGYLNTEGCNASLALNLGELRQLLGGLAAANRFRHSRALVIGEAFPTWSQAASPRRPELVRERLGTELVLRSLEDLTDAVESADQTEAETQARQWLEGAERVDAREAVEQDLAEIAKVHLAIRGMIAEAKADAVTINCRAWDELTMDRFGRFYGPCMALTTLRYEGIPAACEGDICALMALCALSFCSGLPAFLGNIGRLSVDEGWVAVEHAAAAPNMDGSADRLEGYWLTDYQQRGTGCASYCSVPEGQALTIARFSKDLGTISFATGLSRGTDRCFEVLIGTVDDFMHRCLVGDHYGVVYGNHAQALRALARSLSLEVLEAGCRP